MVRSMPPDMSTVPRTIMAVAVAVFCITGSWADRAYAFDQSRTMGASPRGAGRNDADVVAAAKNAQYHAPVGTAIDKILVYPYYDNVVGMTIFGEILPGDDALFRSKVLSSLRAGKLIGVVRIVSPGGNMRAAFNIGRQIRVLQAETHAPRARGTTRICRLDAGLSSTGQANPGPLGTMDYETATRQGDRRCRCESACAVIWFGGVGRHGDVVGVHRPARKDFGKLSIEAAKEEYDRMLEVMRKYMAEMDVPEAIIAVTFATPSVAIRYLTKAELSQMMNFPAYLRELQIARCGRSPGREAAEAAQVKFRSCIKELLKEKYKAGASAYLEKYGSNETGGH